MMVENACALDTGGSGIIYELKSDSRCDTDAAALIMFTAFP